MTIQSQLARAVFLKKWRARRGQHDTTAPTVTGFVATSPSTSLAIAITEFTASEVGASFLITETPDQPAAGAAGWTPSAPTTYTVEGSTTLYPWVKDTNGNVSSAYASPVSVVVLPSWLTAGGLTLSDWVVAHDALYAADLAASYANLANPGTNDLTAPAAAPTWDAVNGWTFNGSTQYLSSVPILMAYSIVIQYTNYVANSGYLMGSYETDKVQAITSSATQTVVNRGGFVAQNVPVFTGGVFIVSGISSYRDGVKDSSETTGAVNSATVPAFLGCVNYPDGGGAFAFTSVKIQRFAITNRELTQGEITAIVAAMGA